MDEKTIAMGLVAMGIAVLAGMVGWFLYESEKQRRLALYWKGEYERCVREHVALLGSAMAREGATEPMPATRFYPTGPWSPAWEDSLREAMAWYGTPGAHQ